MIDRLSKSHSRRGVALVVTVGFLAVLLLLAVAFSISMRVERLAARNFSDTVQARQWAQSALSYALRDLDAQMAAGQMVLPAADHLLSTTGAGNPVQLFVDSATNYIPGSLRQYLAVTSTMPRWVDGKNDSGKVVARYAFQVIDCSGFIDANLGNPTNPVPPPTVRGIATNAYDLVLDPSPGLLEELTSASAGQALKVGLVAGGISGGGANNSPWYEFATLADLWQVAGSPTHGATYGAGIFTNINNFFTYSRFPSGYFTNAVNPADRVRQPVAINFPAAVWDQAGFMSSAEAGLIRSEFTNMGLSYAQADSLTASLAEYCDADNIPRVSSLTNAATEATPLLNEISLEATMATSGTNYVLTIRPQVEVWYPFVGYVNPASYSIAIQITFSNAVPANFNTPNFPAYGKGIAMAQAPWTYDTYFVTPLAPGAGALPECTVTSSAPPSSFASYFAYVNAFVIGGGQRVDAVQGLVIPLSFIPTTAGTGTGGKACNDPRLNAYTNSWIGTGGAGPGAASLTAPRFNAGIATPTAAGSDFAAPYNGTPPYWIYIANRPIKSVGELGMLGSQTNRPWTTVRLFGADAFPVLDHFVMESNAVRHGLVNVNTWNQNVMKTVFHQSPAERYPGDGTPAVTDQERDAAATAVMSAKYCNLSHIASNVVSPTFYVTLDNLRSEGLLRSSAGILGTRQQVYTILVAAQALSDDQAFPVSEQRALAVVWRDPYPNAQGRHDSFVRFFRWLAD